MSTFSVTLLECHIQAAYKTNNDDDFEPQPPVYAVLTDLKDFYFYFFSYDGSSFKMGEERGHNLLME